MDRENWLQAETDEEWLDRISMEAEMEAGTKKPKPIKEKKKRENKKEKKEAPPPKKFPDKVNLPEREVPNVWKDTGYR